MEGLGAWQLSSRRRKARQRRNEENGVHHRHGYGIAQMWVEPTEHVKDLFMIRYRLTEISEAVDALLETSELGDDRAGPLLAATKVSGEEDNLVLHVLQEEG